MEAYLAVVVSEGRVELVCPMDPAALDDHHDVFADFTERRHDLMEILAQLLGIKVGHHLIEDFRGAILDRPNDAEQHATRHTAPGAIADPRLAFERFFPFDLARAQWTDGKTGALSPTPPARPG